MTVSSEQKAVSSKAPGEKRMSRGVVVFLCLLPTVFLPAVLTEAQQPTKVPRIGYLSGGSRSSNEDRIEALRQGLRELGYVEGKNVVIEYRYAERKLDRLRELAFELVRRQVDVIVTVGTTGALAAKRATTIIPIVMGNTGDPVGRGLVASLARPGGNITGLSGLAPDLAGKQLELLKEAVPRLVRVGVFWSPTDPGSTATFTETKLAAQRLGVQVQSLEVRTTQDFNDAFKAATEGRVQGLRVVSTSLINDQRTRVVEFANKRRLPSISNNSEWVDDGGLMSYGPNIADLYRRAAVYVDKILKGAKPADLPVEQPTKFELVINLKTAKQIGLTIPQSVLYRADRVIK